MDGEGKRERLRSFLIGGALGASAALAAARRSRLRRAPRETQAGLAAFEDAPCFRETIAREQQTPS
ncbi:MAG: hypothetical protein ACYDA3_11740 [Gaiellaceae bacterium]